MNNQNRIAIFFAVSILFNMAASFAHPVTPTLFKELGLADYLFGYALAAMLVTNFLLSPFWGRLNSFISCRTTLLISSLGYALGQYFFAIATTELQFIAARIFAGIFTGGSYVSLLNYVVGAAPRERTRGIWLAASATIQSVAGAFGFFVGGMLGALDIRYALFTQVATLAVCGVLFFFICSDHTPSSAKLDWRSILREANPFTSFIASSKFMTALLALMFAVCALHSLGQVAFDQSFNYYIKDQFDFSSAYNGTLKAAMGIITLIANSTICVYLINRTEVRKSIIGLLGLCAVTMAVIITMQSITPFLVVNIFFYAFAAICLPLLQNIAADSAADKDSNLIMGFYNSMKSLGGIIGAAASGSLYTLNPKFPFVCSLTAFALATLCAARYYRGYRVETEKPVQSMPQQK